MTAILSTDHLTIGYDVGHKRQKVVSAGLTLALNPGELVCLIGPNGAGKSTLLRTLVGMQPALAGAVTLDGRGLSHLSMQQIARLMSVVLTEPVNVGLLSARELVALGRYPYTGWLGRLSAHDRDLVEWAIGAVGADDLAHRMISELSDGERQKVMIARALAQEPRVILLDEPTAFLDLPHRVDILGTLRRLAHDGGQAILLSTHDLDLALRSADRIWLMSRDGTVHVGAPEDLVLTGAFQRIFDRQGVSFDPATGSFELHQPTAGVVHLTGEGLAEVWTARALERSGFQVTRNGNAAPVWVEVTGTNGDTRWRCEVSGQMVEVASIQDLVRHLQEGMH
jgi:iron complex transport system ATP-binding protein